MLKKYFTLPFIVLIALSINAVAQNRTGTYQWKYKDTAIRILKVKEIKKGKKKILSFDLRVEQSEYPCVGEFSGKAQQLSKNLFEYNSNMLERSSETNELIYCRLTFAFSGNKVIVRENGCEDFHGARCNFEGEFIRLKSSK